MDPSPFMVLRARAEARALLYREGVFDEKYALHPLYNYAVKSGLADEVGIDTIDNIIRIAFGL